MRTLYLLALIYIGFTLTSCASIDQPKNNLTHPTAVTSPRTSPTCTTTRKKKNPLAVSLYTNSKPKLAYDVIGEESVSRYNQGGNKRQEAIIRDGMRELAANMGGDAVINLKYNGKVISGTVIAFQDKTENNTV